MKPNITQPTPRSQRRRPGYGALALGALLLTSVAGDADAQDAQVINVPLSRPGEAMQLDISILSARIEVLGEDREDVQFEVSAGNGGRKIITPSGTQSLKSAGFAFEVSEDDNRVDLDTDWRTNQVNVVARIPHRADLELSTVNDGEIFVRDVRGSLVLQNTNGPITASGINGSVIAESVNDDIDVSFSGIASDSAMSFSSVNGDLQIGLPEDAGVRLHIDSAKGEILSDFEVVVAPSEPTITREVDKNGGVEISVESVIIADVNGGGTVIKLKTLNGDISIRNAGSR